MNYLNINGQVIERESGFLKPDDHSYRYGDGLFETMKVVDGAILSSVYHFERLFSGIKVLKFEKPGLFKQQKLEQEIIELCRKNKCEKFARARLSVSRGSGGLYDCDNKLKYLIECWPLEKSKNELNGNGLIIDIFPDSTKSCDKFSNLKSANYLPYVMAAVWAKENHLNDALVLNQHLRICDATTANVFWIKDGFIFTPPLTEGCVAGVMRKKILEMANQKKDFLIKEAVLTENILLEADEVFLTNVISGLRWVRQCRDKVYVNQLSGKIFSVLF